LLCRLLERADKASIQELEAGRIQAKGVLLSHKYADSLCVDVTIQFAGERPQATS
jgi:hypothetical protein